MIDTAAPASIWTPARVYSAYRILLAAALSSLFFLTRPLPLVGQYMPSLFAVTVVCYAALTVISIFTTPFLQRRFPNWHSLLPVVVDIIALTLMIHASGGIKGNLSVLLMVSVASASILLPGRGGLFVAALATFAVMAEQFWFSLQVPSTNPLHLTEAGLLGVSFFFTAIIINQIARRLAQTEALSVSQQLEITRLEALNLQIVQRMRTGIVVFNSRQRIIMANQSARDLAAPSRLDAGEQVPKQILDLYQQDHNDPQPARSSIRMGDQGHQVLVRFARLNSDEGDLTLAFLEDQRQIAREAQQLKLASLGRMSATIAHEIRNPLSAINHAAGLLDDTAQEEGDKRLLQIIFSHVARVNGIIDDVLNLSRRPAGAAERFNLLEALREATARWRERGADISLDNVRRDVEVRFDRRQFEQVIDNLVANAQRHAGENCLIRITADKEPSRGLPRLRFSDDGPGIPEEVQPHLFEPFFTTSHEGTGLGLFLCREMCETNQAWLDYDPDGPGAAFVITFAHPDRVFK